MLPVAIRSAVVQEGLSGDSPRRRSV